MIGQVLLHLFLLGTSVLGSSRPISIVTGPSYGGYIDSRKPNGGIMTENIRRVFLDMGFEPSIVHKPWKRAYADTLALRYVATFPWFEDARRKQDFLYSDAILWFSLAGVVQADSGITKLDARTLRRKTVCDLLGSRLLDGYEQRFGFTTTRVATMEQCYEMLLNGRVDFVLVPAHVVIRSLDLNIRVVPHDLPVKLGLHLIIPKALPEAAALMERFNQSLRKLTKKQALLPLVTTTSMRRQELIPARGNGL